MELIKSSLTRAGKAFRAATAPVIRDTPAITAAPARTSRRTQSKWSAAPQAKRETASMQTPNEAQVKFAPSGGAPQSETQPYSVRRLSAEFERDARRYECAL